MSNRIIPWWLYYTAVGGWALYYVFGSLLEGDMVIIAPRVVVLLIFIFLFFNPSERISK